MQRPPETRSLSGFFQSARHVLAIRRLARCAYWATVLACAVTLIAPLHGDWFMGGVMIFAALFGALFEILTATADSLREDGIHMLAVLLPIYNFLLMYTLIKLRRASFMPSPLLCALVTAAAVHACFFLGRAAPQGDHISGQWPLFTWFLAVSLAAPAIWLHRLAAPHNQQQKERAA